MSFLENLHLERSEPEFHSQLTSQRIVSATLVGTRLEAGVSYSLTFLAPTVTLETYKLPDSDEEVAEEEAICRVLKQVRNGSCAFVFLPLGCPSCVCYLVSIKRVCFCSWKSFIPYFPSAFPILAPKGCSTIWQAINNNISSLSHCLCYSCLVSLVVCVCLLYNHTLLVLLHFLFCVFLQPVRTGWWDVCCVALLKPTVLPKMSLNCLAGRPELKFVWYVTSVWLAWWWGYANCTAKQRVWAAGPCCCCRLSTMDTQCSKCRASLHLSG